ncbi:uncharacterized protein LOC132544384 [Ylistrum balloti]|uniref:uncharacterized protein LOC132544384 n=1 Tax=Ylistrum balloti TaxID=509963 RepID=UPI0029058CB6|nr:uncharacterized protein LOC132544384 [Ylistrum balloti]
MNKKENFTQTLQKKYMENATTLGYCRKMLVQRTLLVNVLSMTVSCIYASGLTSEELGYFQTTGRYNATVSINEQTDRYMIIASGEPDHQWEMVNPNRPTHQNYNIPIPKHPTIETVPGCLSLGMIGIARTGVALYNPLDSQNQNAVEGPGAEILDSCDGHASPNGAYHYHKLPFNCLYEGQIDEFMGVAADGYAIYGPKVQENGIVKNLTSADLDKCHGRIGSDGRYRYHMTFTFPYILGCFRGAVLYDMTRTQAVCSSDTSVWDGVYGHYLCNCSTTTTGNTNGDCHPSNPDKPASCCNRPRPPPYCSQTTVSPATTTARPATTTAKPQTTTARPATTTAKPQTTTARPATTTAKPQTTTARPATATAKPQTTTARPPSSTAIPASTTASPSGLNTQELAYFQTSGNFNATVSVIEHADRYMIMASGEPDHQWEMVNPNRPTHQNYNIPIPKHPTIEAVPGCLSLGMIGIARTGVALYNPLDGQNQNAVEGPGAEILDSCDGHASQNGAYHYHKLPFNCLYEGQIDEFMGVAADGYAIYGPKVQENGIVKNLTSADLDKCHGRIGSDGRYRYHMTFTFPYILGCFRGTVLHDMTRTQPICSSDTSAWNNQYNHYLCNCSTMLSNNTDSACHPSQPNKPSFCCDRQPPPPYCNQTTTRTVTSTARPTVYYWSVTEQENKQEWNPGLWCYNGLALLNEPKNHALSAY